LAEYGVNIITRKDHDHGVFIYIIDRMIKSTVDEVDEACVTDGRKENAYKILVAIPEDKTSL
jgi:hypothetical protein